MLFRQRVRRARYFAPTNAGSNSAASTLMMPITTSNSTSVKPPRASRRIRMKDKAVMIHQSRARKNAPPVWGETEFV